MEAASVTGADLNSHDRSHRVVCAPVIQVQEGQLRAGELEDNFRLCGRGSAQWVAAFAFFRAMLDHAKRTGRLGMY